ncbi:MAG: hypothetical protein HY924_12465 [Elusimicrobia bacterium]|nr:hypothetical protein [Elusimicrobiota bacterium]
MTTAWCATAQVWAAPNQPPPPSPFNDAYLVEVHEQCKQGKGDYFQHLKNLQSRPKDVTLRELAPVNNPEMLSTAIAGEQALACLEFAGHKKYSCSYLVNVEADYRGHYFCQELRTTLAYAASLFGQGDEDAAFRAYLPLTLENEKVSEAQKARAKVVFADAFRKGSHQDLCAMAVKNGWVAMEECVSGMAFVPGEPARCHSIKIQDTRRPGQDPVRAAALNKGYEQGYCSAKASLLEGLRSKDPAICAASPLCSAAMKRNPAACEPLVRSANQGFCQRVALFGSPLVKKVQENMSKTAQEKAREAERLRREAQAVADFHKQRKAEERLVQQKLAAEEIKKSQEAAAKERELDEKVRKRMQEKKQKFQYREGERMEGAPPELQQAIRDIEQGKTGPQAKPLYGD